MGFRENVLQILDRKGLKQVDLASILGKSRQNTSLLLKNDKPSMQTLDEFAKALGVEASDLLDDRKDLQFIKNTDDSPNSYQRLFDYFHYKGFHPDEISKLSGIPYLRLYTSALKGEEIDSEIATRLASFDDLNISWVITGEGDMLSDPNIPTWERDHSVPNPQQTWSRILEFLLYSNTPVEEFCAKAEVTMEYFLKGIRGEIGLPFSSAVHLSKIIPGASLEWLTTGDGQMLANGLDESTSNEVDSKEEFELLTSKGGTTFRSIRNSDSILITSPLITLSARALYLQHIEDEKFAIEELTNYVFSLPGLRIGTYRVFEDNTEDSSPEEINSLNTRFVVGRKIEKITKRSAELLHQGQYIFVQENNLSIEEMLNFNAQDNSFVCFSKSLGDVFSIELSKIKQLFIVEAVVNLKI